jgi:hypothetical protein
MTNNANVQWTKSWLTAVDSSIIHLAQEPVGTDVKGLLYVADWFNGTLRHIGSHLGCFHGKYLLKMQWELVSDAFAKVETGSWEAV